MENNFYKKGSSLHLFSNKHKDELKIAVVPPYFLNLFEISQIKTLISCDNVTCLQALAISGLPVEVYYSFYNKNFFSMLRSDISLNAMSYYTKFFIISQYLDNNQTLVE